MSEAVPRCAWCGKEAVTNVVTRRGRKLRKTAPVCEEHAQDFEQREIATTRSEVDSKLEAQRKQAQRKARQAWR